ncbi:MAG: hypothetical protein AAF478_05015 [Pseudomonadota bacterium]
MTYDDKEEQPLDPVMERVRKKMIRLMVISVGIMMVGLLAVLFAIIYKFSNQSGDSDETTARAPGSSVEVNLGLPTTSEVVSTSVSGDRVVLDVKGIDGKRQIFIVNTNTGQLVSTVNVN